MKHKSNLLNLAVMAFMIALGVVISPILRFEGMGSHGIYDSSGSGHFSHTSL